MEKLLTVAEAAPLVNMSQQGLYAAIRAKQFPALHIGRRIRIPQSSVQRWIAEQMQPAHPSGLLQAIEAPAPKTLR